MAKAYFPYWSPRGWGDTVLKIPQIPPLFFPGKEKECTKLDKKIRSYRYKQYVLKKLGVKIHLYD